MHLGRGVWRPNHGRRSRCDRNGFRSGSKSAIHSGSLYTDAAWSLNPIAATAAVNQACSQNLVRDEFYGAAAAIRTSRSSLCEDQSTVDERSCGGDQDRSPTASSSLSAAVTAGTSYERENLGAAVDSRVSPITVPSNTSTRAEARTTAAWTRGATAESPWPRLGWDEPTWAAHSRRTRKVDGAEVCHIPLHQPNDGGARRMVDELHGDTCGDVDLGPFEHDGLPGRVVDAFAGVGAVVGVPDARLGLREINDIHA